MYNAILKWSLSQTDGTQASEVTEMDSEKRAFLEKAMEQLVENDSKKIKELVAALHASEETEEEVGKKEIALEELLDRCDRIDYAITLHTFGNGFLPTIELLKSRHDRIRQKAAELVALCSHNNPACQGWALEAGALQLLDSIHSDSDADVDLRTKALSAISAIVQHNPQATKLFLEMNGVSSLRKNVEGIARRLRVKTLFMLQWLLRDSPTAAQKAVEEELPTVSELCYSLFWNVERIRSLCKEGVGVTRLHVPFCFGGPGSSGTSARLQRRYCREQHRSASGHIRQLSAEQVPRHGQVPVLFGAYMREKRSRAERTFFLKALGSHRFDVVLRQVPVPGKRPSAADFGSEKGRRAVRLRLSAGEMGRAGHRPGAP